MAGRLVAIGVMRLDPPHTKTPGRARYLITLRCSCSWWEDYPVDHVPSRVGDLGVCFNPAHVHEAASRDNHHGSTVSVDASLSAS